MLKIIVFDGDSGGELVASFLAEELKVVEVTSVIDRWHGSYEQKSAAEICTLAEQCLQDYIGKVDLIILGGYTVSLALEYLRGKYNTQKFVGLSVSYHQILKAATYPERITVIMNETLLQSALCEELRDNLPFSTLAIPDCSGWSNLADTGKLSAEVMRIDLGAYFALSPVRQKRPPKKSQASAPKQTILETVLREKYQLPVKEPMPRPVEAPPPSQRLIRSDAVLVLNTCLWDLQKEFEEVFGYRVRVLDFRKKLLRDICICLNLLGVDGGPSK